jgi:predicted metal-dependent hydrolase
MERYLLHFKNDGYLPKNCRELAHKARDLVSDMKNVSVRLTRVATTFTEFDVAAEKEDLDKLLEKLSPIGNVDNVRHVFEERIEKEKGLTDGIFFYNNERFWECHEAFEGVWNQCYGREKELVQGIILVAVAFAHEQANEESIGVGMLGRALEKLGASPSMYHSIDVDRIRTKAIEMQRAKKLTRFEI